METKKKQKPKHTKISEKAFKKMLGEISVSLQSMASSMEKLMEKLRSTSGNAEAESLLLPTKHHWIEDAIKQKEGEKKRREVMMSKLENVRFMATQIQREITEELESEEIFEKKSI